MLVAHFFLQILVNPKVDEDAMHHRSSHVHFTVETFEPRLVHVIDWSHGSPYLIVLLDYVHITLYKYPLLLLLGGSGEIGIIEGRQLRSLDSTQVFA